MQTGFIKNLADLMVNIKDYRNKQEKHWYSCGSSGHLGGDLKCPARGQTCKKCKWQDHFASICKTKPQKLGVNQLQEESYANRDQVDLLLSESVMRYTQICLKVSVGGVELEMLVDSGATNNTDNEETWENLKAIRRSRINLKLLLLTGNYNMLIHPVSPLK